MAPSVFADAAGAELEVGQAIAPERQPDGWANHLACQVDERAGLEEGAVRGLHGLTLHRATHQFCGARLTFLLQEGL